MIDTANINQLTKRRKRRQRSSGTSTKKLSLLGFLLTLQIRTVNSFTDVSLYQKQQRHLHPFYNIPQTTSHVSRKQSTKNAINQEKTNNDTTILLNDIDIHHIERNYDVLSKRNGKSNGHTVSLSSNVTSSKSLLWSKKYKATFSNNQKLWSRRHAKSIEEGIRREQQTTNLLNSVIEGSFLSNKQDDMSTSMSTTTPNDDKDTKDTTVTVANSILRRNLIRDHQKNKKKRKKRRYGARTIAALLNALAEEAQGLQVEVDARDDTPLWDKRVDVVRINFSRYVLPF